MKRVILGIGMCLMEEVTVMNDILLKQFAMMLNLILKEEIDKGIKSEGEERSLWEREDGFSD